MEELHRTHKEPAWAWLGVLLAARSRARDRTTGCGPGGVVTPWSRHAPCGWSA
jgi:hypothetical protein